MVSCGHADALVTGVTRAFQPTLQHIRRVIDVAKGSKFMTTSMIISRGRTVFVGDVAVTERPDGKKWLILRWRWLPKPARWAIFRVAILSFTNFGNPNHALA